MTLMLLNLQTKCMKQESQSQSSYQLAGKHPFAYPQPIFLKSWCLYAKRRGVHSQSQDQQYHEPQLIATMRDLDHFFLYYTSVKLPSECDVDVKVMIFEETCKPSWQAWEDSGSLLIQFKDSKDGNDPEALDQIWEYLVLSMVGNRLDPQVIGLCLNKHQKQSLVEIWLRRLYRRVEIGEEIEKMIEREMDYVVHKLKKKIELKYTQHRESIKKHSTMKCAQHLKSPVKSVSLSLKQRK